MCCDTMLKNTAEELPRMLCTRGLCDHGCVSLTHKTLLNTFITQTHCSIIYFPFYRTLSLFCRTFHRLGLFFFFSPTTFYCFHFLTWLDHWIKRHWHQFYNLQHTWFLFKLFPEGYFTWCWGDQHTADVVLCVVLFFFVYHKDFRVWMKLNSDFSNCFKLIQWL